MIQSENMDIDASSSEKTSFPKLAKPTNEFVFFRVKMTTETATKDLETPALFKNFVLASLKNTYGIVGASISFDVLSWDTKHQEALIRTPKESSSILWSSLTLASGYQGKACRFEMIQASSNLAAVAHSSRQEMTLAAMEQLAKRSREGSMTL